jgi:uncharacterized protein YutE (UPF0331/DUF86 family)
VDVVDLAAAGPVLRARALGPPCEPLYEADPGGYATAQMAALTEAMETLAATARPRTPGGPLSPRRLDADVVRNKLAAIEASREALRAAGPLDASFDLLVEAGVIDDALAAALKPSVGMRNAIVHEYLRLDLARVAAAVPLAIEVYGRYVTAVARAVLAGEAQPPA